ncbi:MAG TPA: MotA/TolQ/ExbB proton channel family protein [bacterium]|nr:MotA/TolQ/ExbB proton channel family protein [bacterium]
MKWLLSFQMTGWFTGGIYVVLILLSVASWALIFQKLSLLRRIRRAEALFKATRPEDLESIQGRLAASSLYLVYREKEQFRAQGKKDRECLEEAIRVSLNEHFQDVGSGMSVLATITSVAPFLGLLGTVWGIMLIFSKLHGQVAGVSEMVAPGVAQALLTTIGGLLVAIPALFFYNYFSMILKHLSNEAENYASRLIYLK